MIVKYRCGPVIHHIVVRAQSISSRNQSFSGHHSVHNILYLLLLFLLLLYCIMRVSKQFCTRSATTWDDETFANRTFVCIVFIRAVRRCFVATNRNSSCSSSTSANVLSCTLFSSYNNKCFRWVIRFRANRKIRTVARLLYCNTHTN